MRACMKSVRADVKMQSGADTDSSESGLQAGSIAGTMIYWRNKSEIAALQSCFGTPTLEVAVVQEDAF